MGLGRDILYGLGAAATSPIWGLSLLKTGKWRTDWAGRFGTPAPGNTPGSTPGSTLEKRHSEAPDAQGTPKRLLLYGVSVGEINLIRNLVAALETLPGAGGLPGGLPGAGVELVIAASTNTGFDRATALYADRHTVVRFPYDFSFAVKKFLDAVRPDAVALVELEVWPNFMDACAARGLPVAVVNGRLTARSFRGYRKIRPLIRGAFSKLSAVAAQTDDYAQRFVALGTPADRVRVFDTMKWDTAAVQDTVDGADQLAQALGIDPDKPLIVAGSTAPGEEQLLIETCPPDAQLLIAPRKPEWFDNVMTFAPDAVRRTTKRAATAGQRIFLLDTIGELRMAYSLADVCIVGRSFTGELYGSDMMEPIALGKPTIIGPYHADFADTMKALSLAQGIWISDNPGQAAAELLQNKTKAQQLAEAGRAVILSRQGSTRRHAELLGDLLGLGSPASPSR